MTRAIRQLLLHYFNIIFCQQAADFTEGKKRFFEPVAFRIEHITGGSAQVCLQTWSTAYCFSMLQICRKITSLVTSR